MINARNIVAAALVAIPGFVTAQGFEGAQLSADVVTRMSDSRLGVTSYAGGVEFGVFSGVSVELDLATHDWRGFSGRSSTLTLHGIYELSSGTNVGVYWGRERFQTDDRVTTYGIEGTVELGALGLEGYLGRYDAAAVSGDLFGVSAAYSLGSAFTLTAGLNTASGVNDFTVTSIGGEYQFGGGPIIHAELAHESSGGLSDTYLGIGARIELGNGTTFGSRGISDRRPVF